MWDFTTMSVRTVLQHTLDGVCEIGQKAVRRVAYVTMPEGPVLILPSFFLPLSLIQ